MYTYNCNLSTRAEDPYLLFDLQYTVLVYRQTYEHFLKPVSIENLLSKEGIPPPVFKKQCGRPKTQRIRKEHRKGRTFVVVTVEALGTISNVVHLHRHQMDGDSELETKIYYLYLSTLIRQVWMSQGTQRTQ